VTTILAERTPAAAPPIARPTCVHHWILPPPSGPTLQAACRKCGAQRMFAAAPNAPTHWDR
jgi:hypothetical protein